MANRLAKDRRKKIQHSDVRAHSPHKNGVGLPASPQVGASDTEKMKQRSGGAAPVGLLDKFQIRGIQRTIEGRGRRTAHDPGADADFFIVLGERFRNAAGCRLHINFPVADKCAHGSDVSEGSAHGEFDLEKI